MNSVVRRCIQGGVQLHRSYGITTCIHLFDQKNNITQTSTLVASNNLPTCSSSLGASVFSRLYSSHKKDHKKGHKKREHSDSDSDSDSDNEGQVKRGNTEFWRRKMRTLHSILDVNNDGVIAYDDFKLLANNFASLGNLKPEAHSEFLDILKQTWEAQWGEITPYNLVNAEQYLTEMHHTINDKELRAKIHHFLPYLFKAVDKDHSGFIALDEYKLFFNCLGLTAEDAAVSFAIIDQNSDGKLSIKEFVKLGREFFLTEDERKVSRMFWGPLVNH